MDARKESGKKNGWSLQSWKEVQRHDDYFWGTRDHLPRFSTLIYENFLKQALSVPSECVIPKSNVPDGFHVNPAPLMNMIEVCCDECCPSACAARWK